MPSVFEVFYTWIQFLNSIYVLRKCIDFPFPGSYVMVSGEQKTEEARLQSHVISSIHQRCLEFYYFMFGPHVGTLKVNMAFQTDLQTNVLKIHGNQGNRWHRGFVRLRPGIYRVLFIATKMGPGTRNAIALDDITIQKCEISGE